MTDQRNFRSSYLGKVGIKGVEEKKSLEIILKEQPLDCKKITQFCIRYSLPVAYRLLVWKLICNVLPPCSDAHNYVWKQRKEQYDNLYLAVKLIFKDMIEMSREEIHLKMYLMEKGSLRFESEKQLLDPESTAFMSVNHIMMEVAEEEEVSTYWLTKAMCSVLRSFKPLHSLMIEQVEHLLKREECEQGVLSQHLAALGAFSHLPLVAWFSSGYASALPQSACERIWDKVIAGSSKILACVAVAILLTFRRPLMARNNMQDINTFLKNIPEEIGDKLAGESILMWQKYGSPLHSNPHKGDSPNTTCDKSHTHS